MPFDELHQLSPGLKNISGKAHERTALQSRSLLKAVAVAENAESGEHEAQIPF